MNYIKELNAFYHHIVFEPLSGAAVALWHTLMHFNNRCGWRAQFSVPATMLELASGVKGSSFKRARDELKQKGFIRVTSRGGNQAAVYQMISRIQDYDTNGALAGDKQPVNQASLLHEDGQDTDVAVSETQISNGSDKGIGTSDAAPVRDENFKQDKITQYVIEGRDDTVPRNVNNRLISTTAHNENHIPDHTATHKMNDNLNDSPVPLIKQKDKQNKTIQNKATTAGAIRFYQENFGVSSSYVQEDIIKWIDDIGEELVLHAMKLALERNKVSWRYAKGILQQWSRKGISSLEDVRGEEVAFQNQRRVRDRGTADWTEPWRSEIVPEWFLERKQKEQNREQKEPAVMTEAEEKEFAELLAEFRGEKRSGELV